MRHLRWILLLVFLSRLGYGLLAAHLGVSDPHKGDAVGYIALSHAMLHGSFSVPGIPEALRTPGYPLLLVPARSHVVLLAIVENAILSVLVAYLIWLLAASLFPGSETYAVGLYCFEPMSLYFSGMVLSETLFAVLVLLFVWLAISDRVALSGIALATAAYVRPVAIYIVIIGVAFLVVRRQFLRAIIFAIFFAAAVLPWIGRNATLFDYPKFSSAGDYNLYFSAAAGIEAFQQGKRASEIAQNWGFNNEPLYFWLHPEQRTWTPGQVYRYMSSKAEAMIWRNLGLYSLLHLKGCAIVLLDPGRSALASLQLLPEDVQMTHLGRRGLLILMPLAAQLLFYYAAAFRGLTSMRPIHAWLIISLTLYFVAVSGMPLANPRYRTPFMPLVCIAAAPVAMRLIDHVKSLRSTSSTVPA